MSVSEDSTETGFIVVEEGSQGSEGVQKVSAIQIEGGLDVGLRLGSLEDGLVLGFEKCFEILL